MPDRLLSFHLQQPWREEAACKGDNEPEIWFPEGVKDIDPRAKQTCNSCPVRLSCLSFALQMEGPEPAHNREGIWGGKSRQERYRMYRGQKKPKIIPEHVPEYVKCKCGCGLSFDQWRTISGSPRLTPREFALRSCQAKFFGRGPSRANRVGQCKAEGCKNTFNPFTTLRGTKTTTARVYCSSACLQQGIPATIRARKVQ